MNGLLETAWLKSSRWLRAVVGAKDKRVQLALVKMLSALRVPHKVIEHAALGFERVPGAVFCLGSGFASELAVLPVPTVLVCYGAGVTDEQIHRINRAHLVTVPFRALTPAGLLRAMVSAQLRTDLELVNDAFADLHGLCLVPRTVIEAFLNDPWSMRRLSDLRRAMNGA